MFWVEIFLILYVATYGRIWGSFASKSWINNEQFISTIYTNIQQ